MAKLLETDIEIKWHYPDPDWQEREAADLEAARNAAKAKHPNDEYAGETVSFSVADGAAVYMVVKSKPLTLQHVNTGDNYFIPYAHVRGLRLSDIKPDIEWQRKQRARSAS